MNPAQLHNKLAAALLKPENEKKCERIDENRKINLSQMAIFCFFLACMDEIFHAHRFGTH